MRPQQIQSQFAALDHGESGPYHHQAPVLGHPGLLSYGDAKGSSFREHEVGPHPNPRALQSYPANYARESLRRESDQFVLPQQPSMKLDSGGHPYQDHFLSFNAPYPRHITGNRAIAPVQPPVLHDYGRPQTAHASALGPPWPLVHASCHQQPSEHGNDDVVDVESSQRFRQPPHKFQNHLRPSTSPSPALQPAQMYSQNLASDGHQEEVPATCGVGIVFHSSSHGSLAVKRLVPGGPAARCGIIKQGDILTHIDETNVYQQTASDINHLISGPQGSYVRLKFKRSGSNPVVAVVERVWAPSTAERSKALSNGGGPPSKVHGSMEVSWLLFVGPNIFLRVFITVLQISQLLWLGDSSNSRDLGWLMENNVSFILNCAAECANHHTEKLNYLHLRLLDKPEENVRRAFDTAFAFLQKAHQAGHVSFIGFYFLLLSLYN
jgi:hypothetical protein